MTTEAITTSGLEPLMSIDDLAGYLGAPVTTIYDWRVSGKGPCAIRMPGVIAKTRSEVADAGHSGADSGGSWL